MKNGKRMISLLLSFCMVLSLTVGVSASEISTETEGTETESAVVQTEESEAGETEAITTETEETETVQNEAAETEVYDSQSEEETAIAQNADDEIAAMAITMGTKPADGTTTGQPFAEGTGGSKNFRIPAMVTLSDGTIVAATDARWNNTGDGGGLDTIVSYSKDNGATWNYTFANYLGDNGNSYNKSSTAFIDPALATDGETVYMLVDLFPAGYALNSANNTPPVGQIGFTDAGYLKLSNNNRSSYDYYLKDGKIYDSSNQEVSGYTVDGKFNISGNGVSTNLFFSDSPYQVYPTDYLYLTSSSDGGATWSNPMLINVKKATEQTCLVGPGRGIVTSTGRIIFPVYEYTSGTQYTSVIYSDDNGATWTRSDNMSAASSEATVVEADGKLYMFTRLGGYYVSSDNGTTWGEKQSVSGISYTTSCQMNAMVYSKKIDGKTAILLSAGTNDRANGKIFVGLVQDDGSISWKYEHQVNTGTYQYSCLSELSDGTVALLYENGAASEKFVTYSIATIANGAVIGETNAGDKNEGTDVIETKNVTLVVGQTSKTYIQSGAYNGEYSDNIASVATEVSEKTAETYLENAAFGVGTFYAADNANADSSDLQLTFESAGNGQYYIKNANGQYVYPNATYSSWGWSGSWSYSLGKGTSGQAVDVTVNTDGSITVSKSL